MKFLSDILAKAGLVVDGTVTLNSVANATTDTDRFIVVESGVVKYRTGTQLLSDIGGISGNQTITLSGDATGSGTTSIAVTLANSGVIAGTYGSSTAVPVITVDAKGRVTGVTTASISGSLTFTGDVTGSGTTGSTTTLTLANSGVTAGTYNNVTVNAKGLVTAGSNVSYLTSYTETDTLATVTGRGATTSTVVTFSGAGDNLTTYSSVRFAGYNQGGGVGYHGFFEVQNTYGSATNGKKFFRLDSSGVLQIISSSYTTNIFNLTDAGALTVPSTFTAGSIVKSGGTSSQFLKADGSVDSTTYQSTSQKGQANGYASLDGSGKVPVSQLPSSIMEYKGTWNASTNSPTLADGTGDTGDVYRVSTAGTRNLGSGSITFDVGDYVIYNGTVWEKSDTTDAVASVNGLTGVVVLTTTNIGEGTNLYYTDARARAALSFTAGSGAYNSTTGVITIPTNTNQLTNGAGFITGYTETDTLSTVVARGNTTSTYISVDYIITTNNGNGTNVRIGDDLWMGDVNLANTVRFMGIQNNANAYIIFGNGDSTALGRAGTGALTYGGNTVYHSGNLTNLNQLTNGPGYVTGNQNITLSGDVTGSGATSIVTTIANNAITTAKINNGAVTAAKLATFGAGEGLSWAANTDGASIIFESTGDGASGGRALSNLLIALTDNGDEGLKVTSAGAELFYVNTNQIQYKGNTIWHSANDGSGSGLDADLLDGYNASQSADASATIVQRDANGYIFGRYFNTPTGGSERNSSGLGYIAGFNSSDYYIRSYTSGAVQSWLGLGSMAYQNTGSYYTTSNSIYTNSGSFTTAGTGWYRVATTGSDGRGTYYVEVYTTGGNHNPSILKIYAQGDWGNDKIVSVETDGGFPASSVRITRGATNTYLEVNFTTQILGASLRVTRLGFDSSVQIYTGALPSGGDTVFDSVSVYSKGYNTPGAVFAKTRMLVGGTDDNSGKADLSVDVGSGGSSTIALAGQYFRVGDSDVNWDLRIQQNGYLRTYGQNLNLTTSAGNYNISFQPNDTQVAYFNTDGLYLSRALIRTTAGTGYLSGNYASSETSGTTGAIYTIGGSYYPTSGSLNTMYGVGYTHTGQGGMISGASGWGFYVAANGTVRAWLGADNGNIIATGDIYANTSSIVATRTWVQSQGYLTSVSDVWVNTSGDTMTGELVFSMSAPQIRFADTDHYDHWIHVNSNRFYVLSDRNGDGAWETPYPMELNSETNTGYIFGGTVWTSSNLTNLNQLTNGPGYVTGGPYIPVSANTNATGWISFSASTQGTPIIKAIQQDTSAGYYLFQGVTGSTEVYRVDRSGGAYFASAVGIGTASPYGLLELNGSGQQWATAPAIRMWDSFNSKGWLVGNVNNVTSGDFYIRTLPSISGVPGAGQQEFTIKHATGYIGIGNTSPSYKLDVSGQIRINNGVGNGSGAVLLVQGSGDVVLSDGGSIFWGAYDYGASTYIRAYDNSDIMYFYSNGTNMAYFRSDRAYFAVNVGIGTSSPSYTLHVNGTGYFNSTLYVNGQTTLDDQVNITSGYSVNFGSSRLHSTDTSYFLGGNVGIGLSNPGAILDVSHTAGTTNIIRVSNGAGNYRWRVDQNFNMYMTNASGVDTFSVTTAGALTATSVTETSTIKIKENIAPVTAALEKVDQLQPVSYNKKGSVTKEIGLIAEDVFDVYPEFVLCDDNGEPVGIHYSRLTAVLIESVKELKTRIQELEKRN